MNYLAHLYLADDSPQSLVGHMLGDFVKGSVDGRFDDGIARGIRMHRKVDAYTDAHPVTLASRRRFGPGHRRFAGIAIDICYDHFLSRHWASLSRSELDAFIGDAYSLLQRHESVLPERLRQILPRMIEENWLGTYASLTGVENTLNRLSRRFRRENPLGGSIIEIERSYEELEMDFLAFFPQLVAHMAQLNGGSSAHWKPFDRQQALRPLGPPRGTHR